MLLAGFQQTDEQCEQLDATTYRIQDKTVTLPVRVRRASNAFATFLVDADAAREWIVDTQLEVVEFLPGKALMQVVGVDYQDNDLGDYAEAGICFFVRQPGSKQGVPIFSAIRDVVRGKAISYIDLLPVNQEFTTHAGRYVWGFPKWNTGVEVKVDGEHLVTRFSDAGKHVFTMKCKLGGRGKLKDQSQSSLSVRENVVYKTHGVINGSGVKFNIGGPTLQLGSHPIADSMRKLGFPKRPLFSGTIKELSMEFEAPLTVAVGEALPD